MSNTRHAVKDAPLNQERYMSSPEYAELRGVMGNAVTAKASVLTSASKRSLLFFLQALSLESGGMRAVAKHIFEMFPERIGTESMIANGVRAGKKLTDQQVEAALKDLDGVGVGADLSEMETLIRLISTTRADESRSKERKDRQAEEDKQYIRAASHEADYYLARCRNVEGLATFLIDLCINPRLLISEPNGASATTRDSEIKGFIEQHEDLTRYEFKTAGLRYFHDICGALFEFQKRHSAAAAESFAKTNAAKKVLQTLDACLHSRRMVLIEGESDAGKSTTAEAWCRMHKGDARFVRLQGVTNKTAFFRAIARALGLASSYMRKATDMQSRIEDMMQRSGLLLVLDESQYAFAQGERIYSRPELVDWIQTALCNHGVPVALIASPLFSKRLHQAERQTIWNSDQFKRRIYRYEVLPAKPTRNDIELVVKHHLPDGGSAEHKFLAGYAATASHPFTAIADTLADAAQLAETAGRARVSLKDLMEAVSTFRATSELAKRQAFDTPQGKQLRKRAEQPLKTHSSAFETELKPEGAEDNFTGRRPVAAHETHSPERNRTEHFQPD